MKSSKANEDVDLQDLIIERDSGARDPRGFARHVLIYVALAWSLFQLWISSPLPFEFNIFILNDTQARSIHLAFALFLAFTAYPTFISSPREYIPIQDWIMGLGAAFCGGYIFLYYHELADRPGLPTEMDKYVAWVGILLLLEAARRSLGLPLMLMGVIFLIYSFFGNAIWMPELIAHKGQSLEKIATHQWLTTEGVFGIALGVSTSFVFLFVLFGALLEKAGAGNYFIKVAFSLLGHLRGGPAKAAVLSSGLTGFISGSSIANVVTTGTFTIPLMKRVGFTSEKAGAVEVSSSVNGQIMPPVMGAAAFLMVEYVGISYREVVKHAFLPAIISYIALLYIVHLEALKAEMTALPKPVTKTWKQKLLSFGLITSSVIIFTGIVYFALDMLKQALGGNAVYVVIGGLLLLYVGLLRYASKFPELEQDDPDSPIVELPETGPTVKTGLHFLIPVVVLIWNLMVERLSPGLSAFWACVVMMAILVTQRPILSFFRKEAQVKAAFKQGLVDLREGLIVGARNMISIGIATAAAGIIVGTVSVSGLGQIMTNIVEALAGDSLLLILLLTALISLILGMGLPTTANYIVVSSIMVGVIQELGAQHGLLVPAIAVHLFVFYFGIMADVTPPVGLASFAAAAISKGDPIMTGFQAFIYSLRTAILPFFFIFNTDLLLIGVHSIPHGIFVFVYATTAILLISSVLQGYFITRCKWYEIIALALIGFTLFRPGVWMDQIFPAYEKMPGANIEQAIMRFDPGVKMKFRMEGLDELGDPRSVYMGISVPNGDTAEARLKALGITYETEENFARIKAVQFASPADKLGLFFDDKIMYIRTPSERPSRYWMFVPATLLLAGVSYLQLRRIKKAQPA